MSNRALLAAIVSFFLPGLGLLLSENKVKGVLIFIVAMIADGIIIFVSTVLTICLVGFVLYFGVTLVHILAAVHSYDTMMKEEKIGKALLFK